MSKKSNTVLIMVLLFATLIIPAIASAQQQMDPAVAARELQEKIRVFNLEFCPPQEPIEEINPETLSRLVEAELIKKDDINANYDQLTMVDGRVYPKGEEPKPESQPQPEPEPQPQPEPQPDPIPEQDPEPAPNPNPPKPKPQPPVGRNLTGALDAACADLENQQTRGETEGNKKPQNYLPLKRRRVTYRDQQNQLKQLEVFSPPRFPAKKKDIREKKGKKIRDFATTIIVPKDTDGQGVDKSAFEDMPSADDWLDDEGGQKQK